MAFKSRIWQPIAIAFSALNLAGAGFAVALEQGEHAAIHVLLAGAAAYWVRRRQQAPGTEVTLGTADREARLEALEADLDSQRRELAEAQERLDFAERLLSQAAERRQVGVEREPPSREG